jgi:hypothetical protein
LPDWQERDLRLAVEAARIALRRGTIVGHPELTGFRSRLVSRSVTSHLGGKIEYDC